MPLFIDLMPVCEHATNDALEYIYKSTHDRDAGIWQPHESVLIRRLIELFSKRGLDRLDHVRQQILAWESGEHHQLVARPTLPSAMSRWSQSELSLVRLYLEAVHPSEWTLDDHMLMVDYVVQTYLPEDALRTESEWLATRATLMGKVQANLDADPTSKQADKILAALPTVAADAVTQFHLNKEQRSVLEFGKVRAAENVRALTETVRHAIRNTVMQHLEEQMTQPDGAGSLQTKLFDRFATLNRDLRRIAVTEAGECHLQGYIASLPPGSKVKRAEQYANACTFCRQIDGKVVEVVPPDAKDKDPDTQIWVGKTNIGRSASPRKRVGDALIARSPEEMWWIPAGTVHPHCRGRWLPTLQDQEGGDPDFAQWLRQTLS